ncbi:MAG TPA: hypothetical protein DGG94_17195 [Micromonosporaceae bacterium]|nr:hypothetical protein [Micromonosporaceae bacterium]HCU51508.1 hypothetical protein [Micromonosporaceae bacterium]
MATPSHAGYAATAVLSQATVNRCLATYIANFAQPVTADITQTVPGGLNGQAVDLRLTGDAVLYGAYATLKKNAAGHLNMTFQFSATSALQRIFGNQVIDSYPVELTIDMHVTVPLTSHMVGNAWQIGVNLANCYVQKIVAKVVLGWLPPEVAGKVKQIAESQLTRSLLNAALVKLGPPLLPLTTTTVPAVFDYSAPKPIEPGPWFTLSLPAAPPVFVPTDGYLVVAVNVPGYTSGHPAALAQYAHDVYPEADLLSSINLSFLTDLMSREILPQLGYTFLAGQVRLNQVLFLQMKLIDVENKKRPGIRAMVDISLFSNEVVHFFIAGTTEIRATVEITGYPYLNHAGRIVFQIVKLDAAIPGWAQAIIRSTAFILPPLTVVAPFMLENLLSGALRDLRIDNARKAHEGAIELGTDRALPGTSAPVFRFAAQRFLFDTEQPRREATASISMRPTARPRLTADVEGTVVSPSEGMDTYDIARNSEIPAWLKFRLTVPSGLFHPQDPTIRVRWETTLNGKTVDMYTKDVRYREAGSTRLEVFPILFTRPDRVDLELRVRCRLYRLIGATSEDFLNQSVRAVSLDPRPDSAKPFVQWAHLVTYWNGIYRTTRRRTSKIHRAPGLGGCRFSGQFLRYPGTNKFQMLRRFSTLPFEFTEIEQHRNEVCPYCFFGGPDKSAYGAQPVLDLTGMGKFRP